MSPQQAGCEMLKCARQRGVGRRVAGSVILCRCLVTTPACWLPARVSIHHTCHVSRGHHTMAPCPQSAGLQDSAVKRSIGSTTGCTITEKAPTRAFFWLKAPTSAFTFKTLLRHYAKRALTPRSLNVKLGPRRNYHEVRVAIRHYTNQPAHPL